LALLLSIPTYLFLERPLKRLRRPEMTRPFGGRIIVAGLVASAFIALFSLVLADSSAFDRNLQAIEIGQPVEAVTGCRNSSGLPDFRHVKPCVFGGVSPSVVFWGDSHTLMLTPLAEWSARAGDRAAVVLGKSTCPPLLGIEIEFFVERTCAGSNDELLAWVEKRPGNPITGAVLAAAWTRYNGQDMPAGDAELPRMLWHDAKRPGSSYSDMLASGLREMLTALSPRRRVLIVGPVPELRHSAVDCLMRAQLNGQPRESCAPDRAEVERRRQEAMEVLQRVVADFPNARMIDPLDVFCDRDKCWPFGPSGVFYADDNHLSALGVEKLYRHFQSDIGWVYGDGPAR